MTNASRWHDAEGVTQIYRLDDGPEKDRLRSQLASVLDNMTDNEDLGSNEELRAIEREVTNISVRRVRTDSPDYDSLGGRASPRDTSLSAMTNGLALFNIPEEIPALWGHGDDVLWAEGEGLMVAAPQGVGKTTIAQQLVVHGLGIRSAPLLGHRVRPMRSVLYLALDRPRQALRSMRRMVSDGDRDALAKGLQIWEGPLPRPLVGSPQLLVEMCSHVNADVLIIDSLKDVAPGLSEDAVGASVNSAIQHVIAARIDVLTLHHTRKTNSESGKRTIDDIYGSTWLTSGMGSVLLLEGRAGSESVRATHVKQPADEVGPLSLRHDHQLGMTTLQSGSDPLKILVSLTGWISAKEFSMALSGDPSPERRLVEQARRQLEKLVEAQQAERHHNFAKYRARTGQ